jgi:site-specific DNA-methyltransferase (adenine-specific)|tara:strand:- start:63 stop:815 length:753 start_codon:yes stop_codon:yes gene_type:complete
MELNKIYNENCLDTMARMEDNFIDLTVTSPPYDNLRMYKGFTMDWQKTINELYRVTKQGGVVVWVVGDSTQKGSETGTSFRQALFAKECGFNLHDTMIYQKSTPPLTHNRYEQNFEYMFVWSKGKPNTFNGLREPREYKDTRKNKAFGRNKDNSVDFGYSTQDKTRLKRNVWKYFAGGGANDKIASKHPAIFPEQLAQDHILSWSNENDLVYDCFMGSGTTAKMAKLNNRNYIGSEISEEYCNIAEERLT